MSASPPPLIRLPHSWRPRRARVVGLTMAGVVSVGGVFLAVALPSSPTSPYAAGDRVGIAMTGLVVAAGLLVLIRPRLVADDDGLTVINFIHRRRLAWAEVVGVDLAATQSWASLDLADGTALPVVALQTADGPQRFRQAVAELAALIDARGSPGPV